MKLREPEDLQPWEVAVAKTCVKDFLGQGRYIDGMEPNDLLQECVLHWLRVKARYDSSSGASAKTFMATVCRNKLKDMLREHGRAKRRASVLSLDAPLDPDDPKATLGDILAGPTVEREFELQETRGRICLAMKRLTERQRKMCELLLDQRDVTEIAELLEVTRPTVYAERERIRKVFEDEGLQEFLP